MKKATLTHPDSDFLQSLENQNMSMEQARSRVLPYVGYIGTCSPKG